MRDDLAGKVFGRLTVIAPADDHISKSGYRTAMWLCRCECGNETIVRAKSLTGGVTKSCGCLRAIATRKNASRHNGFGTRLHAIWNSMRQRCNNQNHR